MKKLFFILLITSSIFCINQAFQQVNASADPVPHLFGTVYYPDTCDSQFWVTFDISNLGATAKSESFLSVSLSKNLELVSWHTSPETPEMKIRIYEKGDNIVDSTGSTIETNNTIIEIYNHEFKNNETIKVTIYFENNLYQGPNEWVKCRLVMYPKDTNFSTNIQDPPESIRKDPQGYPVYQFPVAPNKQIYPIDSEIEEIPEFPSGIIFPVLLVATVVIIVGKNKRRN